MNEETIKQFDAQVKTLEAIQAELSALSESVKKALKAQQDLVSRSKQELRARQELAACTSIQQLKDALGKSSDFFYPAQLMFERFAERALIEAIAPGRFTLLPADEKTPNNLGFDVRGEGGERWLCAAMFFDRWTQVDAQSIVQRLGPILFEAKAKDIPYERCLIITNLSSSIQAFTDNVILDPLVAPLLSQVKLVKLESLQGKLPGGFWGRLAA